MTEERLRADLVLEYPFTRTTGPVIGAFLTGLREQHHLRHQARPTAPCWCHRSSTTRPPLRPSPRWSRSASRVRWSRGPGSIRLDHSHPGTGPHALALDPPRRRRHPDAARRSWSSSADDGVPGCGSPHGGDDEREGHISDLEGFVPEEASDHERSLRPTRRAGPAACRCPPSLAGVEPVQSVRTPIRHGVRLHPRRHAR